MKERKRSNTCRSNLYYVSMDQWWVWKDTIAITLLFCCSNETDWSFPKRVCVHSEKHWFHWTCFKWEIFAEFWFVLIMNFPKVVPWHTLCTWKVIIQKIHNSVLYVAFLHFWCLYYSTVHLQKLFWNNLYAYAKNACIVELLCSLLILLLLSVVNML